MGDKVIILDLPPTMHCQRLSADWYKAWLPEIGSESLSLEGSNLNELYEDLTETVVNIRAAQIADAELTANACN
jgi:hypothetical protein